MKLPALWLALAFASGIAASRFVSGAEPFWLATSVLTIAIGLCLALFAKSPAVAGVFALTAWFAVGGLAAQFQRHDVRPNDVVTLISRGGLDTGEPLRWTGRLREDPASTPLGWRYTIDLQSVEQSGHIFPVRGGLRVTYYHGDANETPPVLRAGDIVEALCRARIPGNYLDPGAFDERAYLARQDIELLGDLRSTTLIQAIGSSRPSIPERLARLRGDLLARLDTLLLVANPGDLFDSSFQLSFLAAGVIAGVAIPWIDRTSTPYQRALEHLSDATRDRLHSPRAAQFRLDLRAAAAAIAKKVPPRIAPHVESFLLHPVRFGLRIWEIFLLSFCIQLGMAPLLALYFHRVSISGPVANVFAVPLTGIIVPLGFLALMASYASFILGSILAKIESALVGLLLLTVKWFSALPRVSWRIPGPPPLLLAAYLLTLVCVAAIAWSAAQPKKDAPAQANLPVTAFTERGCIVVLLSLALLVGIHPFAPHLQKSKLEATVLDVGQGDSIFVAFPDGRTMLVDGGGVGGAARIGGYQVGFDVGEQVVSPYLWSRGIKRLDVVLLTHADHDHIDGLRVVFNNFHVGELWVGRDENRPAYRHLLEQARTRGVAIVHVAQGRISIGMEPTAKSFGPVLPTPPLKLQRRRTTDPSSSESEMDRFISS